MAPFLPVRAISRSQRVRVGGVEIKRNETSYVDLSETAKGKPAAYPPIKELRSHLAIGAVIVVGPITATTEDWVVDPSNGLVTTATTAEEPEVKVTAGELRQRSTGAHAESVAFAKAKAIGKVAAAGKERIDLVVLKDTAGVQEPEIVLGTAALEGAAVAPATPAGKTLLSTITSKNASTTVVIADKRPRQ